MKKDDYTADQNKLDHPNRRFTVIFEGGDDPAGDPIVEILNIFTTITPYTDLRPLQRLHTDITHIFQGDHGIFRYSDAKYHDLRHTRNVVLATIRLLHGLYLQGTKLPPDILELCLVAAYFHDTGMLLTSEDTEHVGSAYLRCHEERSIRFMRQYLLEHEYLTRYVDTCSPIIHSTNLTIEPESIEFADQELQIIGYVLGSADILAQMADRYYLESLPLLYQEQLDAGIESHSSSLELMRQTTRFYHEVIENRLKKSFQNICEAMRTHFNSWWGLDRNLYLELIEKNIEYLEYVVRKHDDGEGGVEDYLRRRQPDPLEF